MSNEIKVRVIATVKVEVELGRFNSKETAEYLHGTAKKEAVEKLLRALNRDPNNLDSMVSVKVIQDPKISLVITEEVNS